jgi:hypothetical protein
MVAALIIPHLSKPGGRAMAIAPNALPFSHREHTADHLQKAGDLARAAVNCNGLFGRRRSIAFAQ